MTGTDCFMVLQSDYYQVLQQQFSLKHVRLMLRQ